MLSYWPRANSASADGRRGSLSGRLDAVIASALLAWIVIVSFKAADIAGGIVRLPFASKAYPNDAQPETVAAAIIIIVVCVTSTILARIVRPDLTWHALYATSSLIILTTAMTTGALGALGAALFICGMVWFGGELLLSIIPGNPEQNLVRVPLAFGAGLGLFGLVWLVLATLGCLDALSIVIATGFVLSCLLIAAYQRTGTWRLSTGIWSSTLPGWYETLLISFTGGLITFALLAAFVPETGGDAIRQHLPIAREFWQHQAVVVLDDMPVTRQSFENHVVLAVAYGFGGMTAAKLLQAAIGVASIGGVAALGWLCHGRFAALVSLCVFGTIPVVLWELGHAFIDMMPVLSTTSALVCVLIWQKENRLAWLVLAGALIGVGVSAKLNMLAVIVAIPIAVLVVGRSPWNSKERLLASAAFCIGAVTLIPWLMFNTFAVGTLPVLDPVLSRLPGNFARESAPPDTVVPAGEAAGDSEFTGPSALWVPFGHEPLDLIRVPWLLTFAGERSAFPVIGRGEIGLTPLLLLPISLFGIRRRPVLLLLIVAAITYIVWWFSPYQIDRHLLPVLAIVAALGGSGLASLLESTRGNRARRACAGAVLAAVIVSVLLASFFYTTSFRAQLPIAFLAGTESYDAVVRRTVRAGGVLLDSNDLLPPGTPVAYLGADSGGAQLYTEAHLVYFPGNVVGLTAQNVLDKLENGQISYVIWQRGETTIRDSSSTVRSTPFLRQYTRILAGDRDAYLFEVLPQGDTIWGEAAVTNLLTDPELQDVKKDDSAWTVEGKRVTARGVIALSRGSTLTQEVPVTAGKAYVLEAPVRCLNSAGRAILTLRWLDAHGNVISTTSEKTMPGKEISEQFLWRRAPVGATQGEAEFSMEGQGRCEYSGTALYELP